MQLDKEEVCGRRNARVVGKISFPGVRVRVRRPFSLLAVAVVY